MEISGYAAFEARPAQCRGCLCFLCKNNQAILGTQPCAAGTKCNGTPNQDSSCKTTSCALVKY